MSYRDAEADADTVLALRSTTLARTGKPNIQPVLAPRSARAGSPGCCVPQGSRAIVPEQCGTVTAWRGSYDIRRER